VIRIASRAAVLLLLAAAAAAQPARKPGLYAVFDTSMGSFVCELFEKYTPQAVANFTGLAQGTKEWLAPKGGLMKKPFYDGVIFHRVVKGFAIQAGDVSRAGNFPSIAPFDDEIVAGIGFARPGMLAMANNGRNTNRTQFFVTVAPEPHLNGKHTIFGRVVEGFEVVQRISEVRVLAQRPVQDVTIRKVTIERVSPPRK
jgi:peptidyl-prolyl cis-trans isomerase A (cyclophilin A)